MIDRIKNTILSNTNLDDESKDLLLTSFNKIYEYFDNNDYLTWINEENLISLLNNMSIDVVKEGDFTSEVRKVKAHYNTNSNKITYLDEYAKTSEVITHENLHLISNNGNIPFPVFLNEGITEYLTGKIEGIHTSSYANNVYVSSFLHAAFVNILIRSYLENSPELFYSLANYYMSDNEGEEELLYYLKGMNKYHYAAYNKEYNYDKQLVIEKYKDGLGYFLKFYIKKLRDEIDNFKYCQNGNIDIKKLIGDVVDVLFEFNNCVKNWHASPCLKLISEIIVNHTYLKSLSENEKANLKHTLSYLINHELNKRVYESRGYKYLDRIEPYLKGLPKYFNDCRNDLIAHFKDNHKLNKDNSNITSYLDALVGLKKGCNLDENEIDELLKEANLETKIIILSTLKEYKQVEIMEKKNALTKMESNKLKKNLLYKAIAKEASYTVKFDLESYVNLYYNFSSIIEASDISDIENITKEVLDSYYTDECRDDPRFKNLVTLIASKITKRSNFGKYNLRYLNKKVDETNNLFYKR